MSLEALWYEASPYAYFVVGLASALFSNSDVGFVFSALLLTASFTILRLRRIHRSPARVESRKYSRPG
jgi:MFS-type transporter involved in bile tolerance (Atg22 family)